MSICIQVARNGIQQRINITDLSEVVIYDHFGNPLALIADNGRSSYRLTRHGDREFPSILKQHGIVPVALEEYKPTVGGPPEGAQIFMP